MFQLQYDFNETILYISEKKYLPCLGTNLNSNEFKFSEMFYIPLRTKVLKHTK